MCNHRHLLQMSVSELLVVLFFFAVVFFLTRYSKICPYKMDFEFVVSQNAKMELSELSVAHFV